MTHATDSHTLLRWSFLKGDKVLTCEIRVNGAQAHDVCVVPHWDVSSTVVERKARAADALRRHAEIAWLFKESGWMLVREASPIRRRSVGAAA